MEDHAGSGVAGGDVNNDGVGDLIIGAYFADPGGRSSAGTTHVVFDSSFATQLAINGVDPNDRSGRSVAVGDINDDGVADLMIGANGADPGARSSAGETYVLLGPLPSGTLELATAADITFNGIDADDGSGWGVASADLNNDGLADLIIGAGDADPGGRSNAGETYVIFGGADVATLSISDTTVVENAGAATLTISLAPAATTDVTVQYDTSNGTATAPQDYTAASGTATIPAGLTSATVSIPIIDDALYEADETFTVTLSTATGDAVISPTGATATFTILDDDPLPELSIADASVGEAAVNAAVTITLDPVSGVDVTVDFATANGSATAPADYTSTSGTATILAGSTSATVSIPITDDLLEEVDETFTVTLSNASNATISATAGTATVTILDDDSAQFSIADVTVDEGAGSMTLTITLSPASDAIASVEYATADGTATAADDYIASSGTKFFSAGQTAGTVVIQIVDDTLEEPDETFTVTLSNAFGANIGVDGATATVTIAQSDLPPQVSIVDQAGDEGAGPAALTITLDRPAGTDVTVDYATADGTATAPEDYTATAGTATIPAGSISANVSIPITNDALDEADETFTVTLSKVIGEADISPTGGTATFTILDNDPRPEVSIADDSVGEAAVNAEVTITLDAVSGLDVTVDFATADGSATAPADYTSTSGTATILAGSTSATVSIPITDDLEKEGDETFTVTLSNASKAIISATAGTATVTIKDDEGPQFSIADVTVDESAGSVTLTITLDPASDDITSVDYATADGTATAPDDYTAAAETVVFFPGATSKTIAIAITDDALGEGAETFTVALSNPVGASISAVGATATVTIADNDVVWTLSVADVSVDEAAGAATLTISLDPTSSVDVTVDYATSDGSAVAPDDYTAASGTATVLAGTTSATISISIVSDASDEPDETFTVSLSNPTEGAIISATAGSATVTILDDDIPMLSIGDETVDEAAGSVTMTVTSDIAPAVDVTVDFATMAGTATAPDDYGSVAGTATIAAGTTAATLSISIVNDIIDELDEQFTVEFSNASGEAVIVDGSATVTILDDDIPILSIRDETVDEAAGSLTITVASDIAPAVDVTVDFATMAGTATAPDDYGSVAGTATIAAGTTAATLSISIVNDMLDELDEQFTVELSNASGEAVILDSSAAVTILDDDPGPSLSIADVSVSEDAANATLTITQDSPSGLDVTVDYATSDGTATAPDDYVASSGTATIPAGAASVTITVPIIDDALDEVDETFTVTLSNPTGGGIIAAGAATVTVVDDDIPVLSIGDVTVGEADGEAVLTISSDIVPLTDIGVGYGTVDGTAVAPDDYTATAGTVTIAGGTTSATVSVPVVHDGDGETNETFSVRIMWTSGEALVGDHKATVTILDDPAPPKVPAISWSGLIGMAVLLLTLVLWRQRRPLVR